jgi:hypothetical protein
MIILSPRRIHEPVRIPRPFLSFNRTLRRRRRRRRRRTLNVLLRVVVYYGRMENVIFILAIVNCRRWA